MQFFLRTTDEEVEKYLRIFTFIRVVELEGIMQDHKVRPTPSGHLSGHLLTGLPPTKQANPKSRIAQKILAAEATELIHGGEIAILFETNFFELRGLTKTSPGQPRVSTKRWLRPLSFTEPTSPTSSRPK